MGLLKTAAKVAVASSVHGRVQRRQQQRWSDQDQVAPAVGAAAVAAVPAAPVPARNTPAPDVSQQLALVSQLNELRQAGALTDAEFDAKKAQILGI